MGSSFNRTRESGGFCYSNSLTQFSFISIVFVNTLFFSGYYILKDPLAYILYSEGIPLKQAYSITTTANTLLALSALFFGFTLHNCGKQKFSLFIGIMLSVISICLLSIKSLTLSMLAVTFYIVGGGLYFFNIVIFINRLFGDSQVRIRGNYIYQIFVNLGAAVGCVLFLMQLNTVNVFKYCLISGASSLLLFILFYKHIEDEQSSKIDSAKFFLYLIMLFCIVYIALNFEQTTRWIVIASFLVAVTYMIYKSNIESNSALLSFIYLVFLFSIPYWIANTIIFNEFFYFLTKDVSSIHGFSPAILIMIDPIVNAFFGSSILLWQGNRIINHYKNLSYSSFLMTISFVVLCVGLFFTNGNQKISFVYPLITMGLFACSEFLLQTTLNARIRDLLLSQRKNEFLATGMMRSSRAFATVIGYYLMTLTVHANASTSDIRSNLNLYFGMVLIFIISYVCYKLIGKSKLI
ncbi:MAG: hypothetical protein ACD_45C00477G0005 [uncultured bacterium]|nr:MAG: hypothetical protein ACD_45C00477G0005 [uncultured bacterium]